MNIKELRLEVFKILVACTCESYSLYYSGKTGWVSYWHLLRLYKSNLSKYDPIHCRDIVQRFYEEGYIECLYVHKEPCCRITELGWSKWSNHIGKKETIKVSSKVLLDDEFDSINNPEWWIAGYQINSNVKLKV
jgi:hypothetical protein